MQDEPRRHGFIWLVYVFLFALAVPWYFPESASSSIWLGFPAWVTLSLAATLGIALFTAYVVGRYWAEDDEE